MTLLALGTPIPVSAHPFTLMLPKDAIDFHVEEYDRGASLHFFGGAYDRSALVERRFAVRSAGHTTPPGATVIGTFTRAGAAQLLVELSD